MSMVFNNTNELDVFEAVASFKSKKNSGLDGVSNELLLQ